MLIIDIASLNIFSYMVSPLINAVLDNCMQENPEEFLERRKRENFDRLSRLCSLWTRIGREVISLCVGK